MGGGSQWEAGKGSLPFERGKSYEFYTSVAVTQTLLRFDTTAALIDLSISLGGRNHVIPSKTNM